MIAPQNIRMMKYGSRYKGIGDVNIPFPWATDYEPNNGSGWLTTAGNIANAAANVTKAITPIFAAQSLQQGQSMMYNPTTGQYVISAGSLPLSLNASGASLSAFSGWLPILGIGLVALLGIKAISK